MRKTNICLGVILALVLLYSSATFAQNGPSGDSGMPDAREMRAVIKAGGTYSSLNTSGSGGGMVATIPITNSDGLKTTMKYSAGEVRSIVSPSFSNAQAGADLRATAGQARIGGTSTDSHYGLGRGHSDAMGAAVNALRGAGSPASQPVVIGGTTYQIIGVAPANQPGWSVTNPNYKGSTNMGGADYTGKLVNNDGTTTDIKKQISTPINFKTDGVIAAQPQIPGLGATTVSRSGSVYTGTINKPTVKSDNSSFINSLSAPLRFGNDNSLNMPNVSLPKVGSSLGFSNSIGRSIEKLD